MHNSPRPARRHYLLHRPRCPGRNVETRSAPSLLGGSIQEQRWKLSSHRSYKIHELHDVTLHTKLTHQMPFFHNSLVRMIAHIASSPGF